MNSVYAGVYLLDAPFQIDREYDYRIPEGMEIAPGDFLSVPFGSGNRRMIALCTAVRDSSDTPEDKLKPVAGVCSREVSLDTEMLGLCRFMKEQTLCTTGDAVRAMLPPAALSRLTEFYLPNPAYAEPEAAVDIENDDPAALMVLEYVRGRGRVSAAALTSRFGAQASGIADALCGGRVPLLIRELETAGGDARGEMYCEPVLSPDGLRAVLDKRHPDIKRPASAIQVAITESLIGCGDGIRETELEEKFGKCRAQILSLEKKGVLRRVMRDAERLLKSSRSFPVTDGRTAHCFTA